MWRGFWSFGWSLNLLRHCELEDCTDRHTEKRGLKSWFLYKKLMCIFTDREWHKIMSTQWPFYLLVLSLYACIVDVAIMAFPEDFLWCALFLYEILYIFKFVFLVFYLFLFLWQYLCTWLTMHPNSFNLVIACLIVGRELI